jgi:hypothetical protein
MALPHAKTGKGRVPDPQRSRGQWALPRIGGVITASSFNPLLATMADQTSATTKGTSNRSLSSFTGVFSRASRRVRATFAAALTKLGLATGEFFPVPGVLCVAVSHKISRVAVFLDTRLTALCRQPPRGSFCR